MVPLEQGYAYYCQNYGQGDRFQIYFRCLDSDSPQNALIFNRFRPEIQIAQTLRSQSHSGFFPGLENANRTEIERDDQQQTPVPGRVKLLDDSEKNNAGHQHRHAAIQPLTPLSGSNIRASRVMSHQFSALFLFFHEYYGKIIADR